MFTIARVSTQIQANHIAWSTAVDTANNIEEARQKAEEIWQEMCKQFDLLPQGEGFIMGEQVIVHDGETIY